jgi:hypothetical protein
MMVYLRIVPDVIYTASDLDRRRREVTDTARRGLARIRDADGMGLVLMPARHYDVLEAVSRWHDRLDVVERARAKPAADRLPRDYGDLTWLRHLDDDDLTVFIGEVRAAVLVAYHDDDLTELDQLVRDWRATAGELADPARREVLLGGLEPGDFVEAARPEQHHSK